MQESILIRGFQRKVQDSRNRSRYYGFPQGGMCKTATSSSSSDRTEDRGVAVADPANSPVSRWPGARLGLGEGKGVDGNQVGALTDVEDGGEQLKSGDGQEVAAGRLGLQWCLAPVVFRRRKRGGGRPAGVVELPAASPRSRCSTSAA
jgi:hypothetical protein